MPEISFKDLMEMDQQSKLRRYRELNAHVIKGKTLLAGSSLMENFPVNEMLMSRGNTKTVYNRGIGGMVLDQYIEHVQTVILDLAPEKLFINIGTNDLSFPGDTVGNLIAKYRRLLQIVMDALPDCKITLLAYYPRTAGTPTPPPMPGMIARTQENVDLANEKLEEMARQLGLGFLNLNAAVAGPDGFMDPAIAMDDIHFSPAGYERVLDLLEPYL